MVPERRGRDGADKWQLVHQSILEDIIADLVQSVGAVVRELLAQHLALIAGKSRAQRDDLWLPDNPYYQTYVYSLEYGKRTVGGLILLVRWRNAERQRYYVAEVVTDLLGDRVVACAWGALGSHRGGHRDHPVLTEDEALAKLNEIAAIRARHGYRVA